MWYVRQMKLFDFINCQASWMPGKLHGSFFPPPNKRHPGTPLGTSSMTLKISQKLRINWEERT